VRRARFLAPARREYIHEVKFYSEAGTGVGIRFAAAVEEATVRALAFPQAGSPAAALFENLEDGALASQFVEWFPGVTLKQVRTVLEHAARSALAPA